MTREYEWLTFDSAAFEAERDRKLAETRALWAKNGRILAERLGYPEGVVEQCEALGDEFPLYRFSYWDKDVGWSRKGWYARTWRSYRDDPEFFAETADALRDMVKNAPVSDEGPL